MTGRDCGALSACRHRPAQIPRAGDSEAPRELRRARDPDARAADDRRLRGALAQLERRLVEGKAVVLARHAERLAEPSWAGSEQPRLVEAAPGSHRVQAGDRL